MTQTHVIECITFEAPDDWTFEKLDSESEVSATITSPGASFLTISLYRERPDPAQLMETAVEAFRGEYEDLDFYPVKARLCDRDAEACDLDFVCLDLVNSVFLRSFPTERFTVFILCQTGGPELDETRDIFDKLTSGMICEEGNLPPEFELPWE